MKRNNNFWFLRENKSFICFQTRKTQYFFCVVTTYYEKLVLFCVLQPRKRDGFGNKINIPEVLRTIG